MSNKYAHIKMLKYSIAKIENIKDYNKKLGFLTDFRDNEIIDQEAFIELRDFLDKNLNRLGLRKE